MNGYELPATCGSCAGPLEHVNSALVCGTETSAIARCADCGAEWQVWVRLLRVRSTRHDGIVHAHTGTLPYPTRGQYSAGCRCEGCTQAESKYRGEWNRRAREQVTA